MRLCAANDRLLVPQHRVILDVPPQVGHVNVMRVVGMTGLAGRVNGERITQVAQVYDHAHGWDGGDFEAFGCIPSGSIHNRSAASRGEWPPVEEGLRANPPNAESRKHRTSARFAAIFPLPAKME